MLIGKFVNQVMNELSPWLVQGSEIKFEMNVRILWSSDGNCYAYVSDQSCPSGALHKVSFSIYPERDHSNYADEK